MVEQARERPFSVERPAGVDPAAAERLMQAEREASVESFHFGVGIAAGLVGLGGALGLAGIRNPRRRVQAGECAGGQLVGAPRDASRQSPCEWHRAREALTS